MTERLIHSLNNLPFNIRWEALVSQWQSAGWLGEDDEIVVQAKGLHEDYIREVESVETEKGVYVLPVNRAGLFDRLPEGLFHPARDGKPLTGGKEMADASRRREREEKDARQFFLPIEQGFWQTRLELEKEEQRAMPGWSESSTFPMVARFWGLDETFDPAQVALLVQLLPIAHRIAGNLEWVASCLELMTEQPVSLAWKDGGEQVTKVMPKERVGAMLLGVDTVVGNRFDAGIPAIFVSVSLPSKAALWGFLPGQHKRWQLERFCGWLLPFEADLVIEVEINPPERDFILNEDLNGARLGFSLAL